MHISILLTSGMPGLQRRQAPDIKEGPSPDRDHDSDDKSAPVRPAPAAPMGLGRVFDGQA
jgi:hypothetical protein